jgi:hypothetical protein
MPGSRDSFHAPSSVALLGWATAASARATQRREHAAADALMPDDARLDERTRAAVRGRLAALVGTIERELRIGAARRLSQRGAGDAAAALATSPAPLLDKPANAGVLAGPDLVAELVDQAALAQLAADLHAAIDEGSDRPSLLVRLADCPEPPVAQAAATLLAAINGTRSGDASIGAPHHAELCWTVAAMLARDSGGVADQAIVEAALELLSALPAPNEQQAAGALARAIAAQPDELPDLLIEALGNRAPSLFVALLAEALALPESEVREFLLDRDAARLIVALRAAGLARGVIARIGVALAQADPRRDLERFADLLDAAVTLDPADALAALAPLAWPQPFRRARLRLRDA